MRAKTRGRRRGFSLAELLTAILLAGLLAGGTVLIWPRWTARREADRALRWLEALFIRADREGRSFSLAVMEGADSRLRAAWRNSITVETLRASAGCSFQSMNAPVTPPTYSPQWGTLTPALTIRVRDDQGGEHYVILSGQGRLRTSPEDVD